VPSFQVAPGVPNKKDIKVSKKDEKDIKVSKERNYKVKAVPRAVDSIQIQTSRDAFPMSADISEPKATIQSRPPD
jgi:hypothetical protein